jgi:hypothetical protein
MWLSLLLATDAALSVLDVSAPRGGALTMLERLSPVPPTVTSPRDACTGQSANLAAAECTAWVSLYDGTGGATQWTHCGGNRLDPCGCSYVDSTHKYTHDVSCSADGQHILQL